MTTRSQVLGTHVSAATRDVAVIFTCPPGFVTLFKSAYGIQNSAAAADVSLTLLSAATGVVIAVYSAQVAAFTAFFWEGWTVLEPGDEIRAYGSAAGISFWASGALLPVPG
jgi:hypothetical protein